MHASTHFAPEDLITRENNAPVCCAAGRRACHHGDDKYEHISVLYSSTHALCSSRFLSDKVFCKMYICTYVCMYVLTYDVMCGVEADAAAYLLLLPTFEK